MLFKKRENQSLIDVQEHLLRLLNTRKGSLSYLPDYGLPDLNEVYQQLPESMGFLVSAVKDLIIHYEPRLKNLTIVPYLSDVVDCVVYLKLEASLEVGEMKVHFDTYFLSGGEAQIQCLD
jgi:type VI secretion system protein